MRKEAIQVDPASLDKYTGTYKLPGENQNVVITKEGNSLFAKPTGDNKVALIPVGPDEFLISELNARLHFVSDDKGNVTKIELDMNNSKVDLPRTQ